MSKKEPEPDTPEYIESPEEMAEEAAQRLCTVLTLLDAEVNNRAGEDGGYSLYTAIDLITRIQADLLKSVAHAEAGRAKAAQS